METMKQSDREAVKLDEALSSLLGTCIYTHGCVFILVGRYNEISTLKLNLTLMDHLPNQQGSQPSCFANLVIPA